MLAGEPPLITTTVDQPIDYRNCWANLSAKNISIEVGVARHRFTNFFWITDLQVTAAARVICQMPAIHQVGAASAH